MTHQREAIVAKATGAGEAAIGIIRLSGKDTFTLIAPIFSRSMPFKHGYLRRVTLVNPKNGDWLDDAMAVSFAGPRSFTGEDMVELHVHGGPYLLKRICEICYGLGFRQALAGEFSERAYLNGKMDLTQAEGIAELTHAVSEQQWIAARQLASGRFAASVIALRDGLREAMAVLEAQIDFPDEGDTAHLSLKAVDEKVQVVSDQIDLMIASRDQGRISRQGFKVALVGDPNAGKSTLMNALLETDRAIVSDIPGTTRDYIEESCLIFGKLFKIVDTAGIRDTDDPLEKLGIERSINVARSADLCIYVVSSMSQNPIGRIAYWQEVIKPQRELVVVSKKDLGPAVWQADLTLPSTALSCMEPFSVSGLNELYKLLASYVDNMMERADEGLLVSSERHLVALEKASGALKRYFDARREGSFEELLAFEVREAATELMNIIGFVDSDDVLDVVFSQFCIGK